MLWCSILLVSIFFVNIYLLTEGEPIGARTQHPTIMIVYVFFVTHFHLTKCLNIVVSWNLAYTDYPALVVALLSSFGLGVWVNS